MGFAVAVAIALFRLLLEAVGRPADWRPGAETASIPSDMLPAMVIRINIYTEVSEYIHAPAMVSRDG
jgi:hypothetical protein